MSFLRLTHAARIALSRSYATAAKAEPASTNLATYLLGAGLIGSGAFYYSTLGSAQATTDLKSKSTSVANVFPTVAALVSDEFRNLRLESIQPYNHNTSTFTFALPAGTNSGMITASALVVKSATEGLALAKNGKAAIRPYTPTTAPGVEGKLVRCSFSSRISFRRY